MDGTPRVRLRFNILIERAACDLLAGDQHTLHRSITVLRSSTTCGQTCLLAGFILFCLGVAAIDADAD
jgi:hypothetical protein